MAERKLPVAGTARPRVYHEMQERYPARASNPRDRVAVELLTDPWSVWCWGFEPVRRALELRFPTVRFRFLLGGMFPQVPRPEEAGFDVERFFAQVQRTTGMPLHAPWLKEDPPRSTFPACIHAHAARLASPEREAAFLRLLREAAYVDGRNINRREVAEAVARQAGVDVERFGASLDDGEAEQEFKARMEALERLKLFAYPTLLVTSGRRTARVEGFHPLPAVLSIVEAVTGQLHPPLPDPPLERVLPPGERVATREVAEALGVSAEKAYDLLAGEEREQRVERTRLASGDLWRRRTD